MDKMARYPNINVVTVCGHNAFNNNHTKILYHKYRITKIGDMGENLRIFQRESNRKKINTKKISFNSVKETKLRI